MKRRYWASIEDINRILQVTNIVDPLNPNAVPIEGVRVAKISTDRTLIRSRFKNEGSFDTPLTFANGTAANPGVVLREHDGDCSGIYYSPANSSIGISHDGYYAGGLGLNGLGTLGFNSENGIDFHDAEFINVQRGTSQYLYELVGSNVSVKTDVSGVLLRIPLILGANGKPFVLSAKLTIMMMSSFNGISNEAYSETFQFVAVKPVNSSVVIHDRFNIRRIMPPFLLSSLFYITGGMNEIIVGVNSIPREPVDGGRDEPEPEPEPEPEAPTITYTTCCEIQRVDY